MRRQPARKMKKKADWSRATRPHQVQNAQALVKRGQEAKRTKKEEGRQFEDQAP